MLFFQVTYKALEQFSESDFDLEKLEKTVDKTYHVISNYNLGFWKNQ